VFHSAADIGCADLDNTGYPDIVYLDHSNTIHGGKWQVIRNQGEMKFEDWISVLPDPDTYRGIPIGGGPGFIYDLNTDGWPDLLQPSDGDGGMKILWNTGGAFSVGQFPVATIPGTATGMADFDGDGKPDIWLSEGFLQPAIILYGR